MTFSYNHVVSVGGRLWVIDLRIHLTVDEVSERSDLVCIVAFSKLEAINNFEADRVCPCLKCQEISIEAAYP